MPQSFHIALLLIVAFACLPALAQPNPTASADLTQLVDQTDRDRVLKQADDFLKESPVTITAFKAPRSAGGLHDFFSEGDYWWPDPKNPDGPYIQRDGMTNPDNFLAHRKALFAMCVQVPNLTSAFVLTGDEKYANHAIKHLKAWFADNETRMNPTLQYAQAIHGVTTGRGIGIIDTLHLTEVARSIEILQSKNALKDPDLSAIKQWFKDYLAWMTTSKNGQDEMNAKNNHGTCFAVQEAAFAHLVADETKLNDCRKRFKEVFLPNQLAPDGSFPQELRRTKPYSYSMFNLDAMAALCQIASTSDDNLWTFALPDGRTFRKAIDYMYPYVKDKTTWPKPPDVMYWENWPVRTQTWLFAYQQFNDEKYLTLWKSLKPDYSVEEVMRNVPLRQPILWQN